MCALALFVVYWQINKRGFAWFMSAERNQQKRNRILTWIINLVGILVFALILYLGGVEAWRRIIQSDWRYLLAGLVATLVWNRIAAHCWFLIADAVTEGNPGPRYRYYFTYHMLGMAIGQLVPISVGRRAVARGPQPVGNCFAAPGRPLGPARQVL